MRWKRSFLCRRILASNPRYFRLCRWAAQGSQPDPRFLLNLHVVRKVLRKFVNWRLVRCSLGTVRPSGPRSLSLPSPTNLDRVARHSIETDSAFHRTSQINRALLHVSGSARPESCWSAARRAQRRRFVTGLRPGKALPPAVTCVQTA